LPAIEEVVGGGITGGEAGGASGVVRALTRLGPGRTMEGVVGFKIGLTSSSSRNIDFRCRPTRSASCSIAFTLKQVLLSLGCFIASNKLKVTFRSSTLISKLSFPMPTTHFVVSMNGRSNIKGIFKSSSISIITKSNGKVNWRTLIKTSSTTPYGLLIERSTS